MSSEEARQIVQDGLDRMKQERAKMEAELEYQERILRLKINDNHHYRTLSEYQKLEIRKEAERNRYEQKKKRHDEMVAIDMKAEKAVNNYGLFCGAMIFLAAVSRLNIFVFIATVLGAAVFPTAYIYRLYNPIEEIAG